MGLNSLSQKNSIPQRFLVAETERHNNELSLRKIAHNGLKNMARAAALVAALQAYQQGAAAEEKDKTGIDAPQVSDLLQSHESTGIITLSSGETLRIPQKNERFNSITVHAPKDIAPDAVIVLFKLTHEVPKQRLDRVDNDRKKEALGELVSSQRAVYAELKTMAQHGTISKVCSENIVDDDDMKKKAAYYREFQAEDTAQTIAEYLPGSDVAKAVERRKEIFADGNLTPIEYDELKSNIEPIERKYVAEYKYAIGAANVLAAEGVVELCPAASRATYDVAFSKTIEDIESRPARTWTSKEAAYYKKTVVDDREDAAVALTVAQGQKIIALQYGADHQFIDAMLRWNEQHSRNQIALVIVPDVGSQHDGSNYH